MITSSSTKPSGDGITSSSDKMIGIGGLSRSGKDSLAELFMQHGFYGVSLGDIIRRHTRERHANKPDPISVANMTETANWLRELKGADVVLREALELYEAEKSKGNKYSGLVLFSVRAPIEADFILAHSGELIWVEASDEIRYERMVSNLRDGEVKVDLEEFARQENLQAAPQPGVPVEAQMNSSYIKQKATIVFENNHNDLKDFETRGQALIQRLAG